MDKMLAEIRLHRRMLMFNGDVFSPELRLIQDLLHKPDYESKYDRIGSLIHQVYVSEQRDIEDLGDIIMVLNMCLLDNLNTTKSVELHNNVVGLRLVTKKLAKRKYKLGVECMNHGNAPFIHVSECQYQYAELCSMWKQSCEQLTKATPK